MVKDKLFTTAYTKEINEKERTLVAWGSKAIIDRDKEIIRGDAWDLASYQKHPIILLSHNYKDLWVGKALWIKTSDEGLLFKAQFATTVAAQEAFQLVKDTGIAAFSVGFIPKKWEEKRVSELDEMDQKMVKEAGLTDKDTVKIHTKCELLEISLVSVPSCSTAVLTAYNEGRIKTKDLQEKLDEVIEIVEEKEEDGLLANKKTRELLLDMADDSIEKEVITKPETTENYHHVPAPGEEGKHNEHKVRTMDISAEKGRYCVDCKKMISYLFDVNKWTMERAKKWVVDNAKHYEGVEIKLEEEPEVKPEVKAEIKEEVPNENKDMIELATKYGTVLAEKSILECDIELRNVTIKELETKISEIELKQGAVLNKKNKSALKDAQDKIQSVLDSAEPANNETIEIEEEKEEVKEEKKELDIDVNDIKTIINDALKAQVNNVTDNFKQEIDNSIKRITGKVM